MSKIKYFKDHPVFGDRLKTLESGLKEMIANFHKQIEHLPPNLRKQMEGGVNRAIRSARNSFGRQYGRNKYVPH